MLKRTIKVNGCGHEKIAPDWTVVTMTIEARNEEYAEVIRISEERLMELRTAILNIGFTVNDLKTGNYQVNTEYESICDEHGIYRQQRKGYLLSHELVLSFPMDAGRLSQVVNAITSSSAEAFFRISFQVRDTEAVKERLLRSTTVDAKRQAKILCESAGVLLGQLVSMNYEWNDMDFQSSTGYAVRPEAVFRAKAACTMDFVPEDIAVSLAASYVWEIL